ncbi:MAG TPA: class I SAM-dependent methyltransferase [Vicinamibacteria bacterium]
MTALRARAAKSAWRGWYGFLEWYTRRRGARFTMMNWGYDDGRARVAADEPERFPLQLYHAVLEGVPLEGRTVADVSCGRGGGLAWVERTFGPARAIGIDFTPSQVALCRATWADRQPRLEFRAGDAESLPLPEASTDVLLSVEASHCYADVRRFLDEARRVLRPGGLLCWADFTPAENDARLGAWSRERFAHVEERDITAHVLAAIEADRQRRRALIDHHAARVLRPILLNFAAADERCDSVQRFRSGRDVYFMRRLAPA